MIRPTRAELQEAISMCNVGGLRRQCPVCGGELTDCPHIGDDMQKWLDAHPAPDGYFAEERGAASAAYAPNATAELARLARPIYRCKALKPDGGIVDGCGWQGLATDACPECKSTILRMVEWPPSHMRPTPAAAPAETRVTDAKTGGQKGVKLERFDLVPFEPFTALARLYGKGALKYAPDNWRRGYAWRLSLGGMLRHVALWAVGKSWDTADGTKDGPCELDAEGKPIHTGEHHLTCAAWHCFTLYVFETQNLGTDDRAKTA